MPNWNVLLVDDEVEFVTTLAERLSLRGVQARIAHSGEQALQRIAEELPQVVVLDLMMPGMSGLEALQRIKSRFPDVEVLLLTGIGTAKEANEGIRLGAFDYLMKPLQIEALMEKMRAAIGKHA